MSEPLLPEPAAQAADQFGEDESGEDEFDEIERPVDPDVLPRTGGDAESDVPAEPDWPQAAVAAPRPHDGLTPEELAADLADE